MNRPVIHIVSGDLWAGKEVQLGLQLCALTKLGEEVAVLVFNEGVVAERFRELGIRVLVADEQLSFIVWIRTASALVSSIKPRILVSHGYKESILAAYLSQTFKVPWGVTFHGYAERYSGLKALKNRLLRFTQINLARYHASFVICVSWALSAELGLQQHRELRIVRNVANGPSPIDENTNLPQPEAVLKHPETVLKHPAIVMIGRLVSVKRVDLGIKVLERVCIRRRASGLPLPTLYIIGSGPEEQALKALAQDSEERENIVFLGFSETATSHIAAAEILLLTSDTEGLPTVLLEALACGTMVVTSGVGGIPETAELFEGYPIRVCSVGDIEAFTSAILELLHSSQPDGSSEKYREIFLENFSPSVAAQAHQEIYARFAK